MLTFAFDALNRMTAKMVPDGCAPIQAGGCTPAAATRDVYYGYDLWGLQTYARFDGPTGEGVDTAYDGFGQLAGSTTAMAGTSRAIGYQYDADGNRIQITTPGGTWSYGYDGLDRLAGLYEGAGTAVNLSLWSYDVRGLPASVAERYGNSTQELSPSQTAAYIGEHFNGRLLLVTLSASKFPIDLSDHRFHVGCTISFFFRILRHLERNSPISGPPLPARQQRGHCAGLGHRRD